MIRESFTSAHVHLHNPVCTVSGTADGQLVMVSIDRAALLVFSTVEDIDAVIAGLADARGKLVLNRLAAEL